MQGSLATTHFHSEHLSLLLTLISYWRGWTLLTNSTWAAERVRVVESQSWAAILTSTLQRPSLIYRGYFWVYVTSWHSLRTNWTMGNGLDCPAMCKVLDWWRKISRQGSGPAVRCFAFSLAKVSRMTIWSAHSRWRGNARTDRCTRALTHSCNSAVDLHTLHPNPLLS